MIVTMEKRGSGIIMRMMTRMNWLKDHSMNIQFHILEHPQLMNIWGQSSTGQSDFAVSIVLLNYTTLQYILHFCTFEWRVESIHTFTVLDNKKVSQYTFHCLMLHYSKVHFNGVYISVQLVTFRWSVVSAAHVLIVLDNEITVYYISLHSCTFQYSSLHFNAV